MKSMSKDTQPRQSALVQLEELNVRFAQRSPAAQPAAKYKITVKGAVIGLRLVEFGWDRPHNFDEASTIDYPTGTEVIVQWVVEGDRGASIGLAFQNTRGRVVIVQESKIPDDSGFHQNGALFRVP